MFRAMTMMCRLAADMRKLIIMLSVSVILASVFVSCESANKTADSGEVTVITDENGDTKRYVLEENNGTTAFAEVVTGKDCEAVTDESGEYVTVTTDANEAIMQSDREKGTDSDDNEVLFDEEENRIAETQAEEEPTEHITDADGWINRWY